MSWLNNNTTKHVGVPHGNIGRNNAPSIKERIMPETGQPSRFGGGGTEKWGRERGKLGRPKRSSSVPSTRMAPS